MKKILFIILSVFIMPYTFSQEEINTRFKDRKQEGYFNTTQIGMLIGNRPINNNNPNYYNARTEVFSSVTMTHGRFDEYWATGIGTGFEVFDRNLFPLFADFRYTLRDNDISPFFALKIGYAFGGEKKHYNNLTTNHEPYYLSNAYYKKGGGFMLNPEMGVKFPLSEKADLLFTVAYRYQKTKSTASEKYGHREWEYIESLNRLSFGAAIMFR